MEVVKVVAIFWVNVRLQAAKSRELLTIVCNYGLYLALMIGRPYCSKTVALSRGFMVQVLVGHGAPVV